MSFRLDFDLTMNNADQTKMGSGGVIGGGMHDYQDRDDNMSILNQFKEADALNKMNSNQQ